MGDATVIRRPAMVMSGVGVAAALALWIASSPDDTAVAVTGGSAEAPARLASAAAPASLDPPMQATPAIPTGAPPVPLPALPSATTGFAVPVTVTAPQKVLVGEINDLVVSVGANAGFGEIGFTVHFDPDVLQVRAGTQGGWAVAVGANPRFSAEISGAEDRVQIRSVASNPRAGLAGGSIATVQFQALATGTTTVLITDVVVKDSAGRSMVPAVSASNLQVSVESVPPRPPAARREHGAVIVEQPAPAREEGD
jgi:hypothetical protein